MKILAICQYYYPENFQINDICEQLVHDGNEVTVITGLPNYPSGIIPCEYKHGQNRDEMINGVRVIRCFEIARRKGIVGLAVNYLSYCISATFKANKLTGDFDIVFVYQLSPVLMAIPGIKYAHKNKIPLLLYCCDLWPESMKLIIKEEHNFLFQVIKKISTSIYTACNRILTQSTSFIPYMEHVHSIPHNKLAYLPAFASEDYLKIAPTSGTGTINFVFLGNIGIAQNVEGIIDAVAGLSDLEGFLVHIVGDGSNLENVMRKVSNLGLDNNIRFYGRRPVKEMPYFYKLADACIVSLNADNLTGLTLPSKVQGYMAAGKPIIGMIDGSAREVIHESGCGICVPSGDVKGMSNIMRDFITNGYKYKDCGANGRRYFMKHFSKKVFMDTLYNEFNELRNVKNAAIC